MRRVVATLRFGTSLLVLLPAARPYWSTSVRLKQNQHAELTGLSDCVRARPDVQHYDDDLYGPLLVDPATP